MGEEAGRETPSGCGALIVEDSEPTRTALVRILSALGFQSCPAETVADGLEKLDGQQAWLLDLNLPDGLVTVILRKIRAEGRPIRVAVITASEDPAPLAEVARLRPDALFRKPLDVGQMQAWLQRIGSE